MHCIFKESKQKVLNPRIFYSISLDFAAPKVKDHWETKNMTTELERQ